MVIFGAGASNDSLLIPHDAQQLPPLTDELLNFAGRGDRQTMLKEYKGAAPIAQIIAAELAAAPGRTTVERELSKLWREGKTRLQRRHHLLAFRYFLRDVLWEAGDRVLAADGSRTNYVAIVDVLERWRGRSGARIAYVTFNYDILLEDALSQVTSNRFESIERYVSDERSVFKMHGSVNWAQEIEGPEVALSHVTNANEMIPLAPELQMRDVFHVVGDRQFYRIGAGKEYIPALALPLISKSAFVMPLRHQQRFIEWLPHVRYVLVVGWKAGEATFLDALRTAPNAGPMEVVTRRQASARRVGGRLDASGFTRLSLAHGGGFKAFATRDSLSQLRERLAGTDWRARRRRASR